MSTMAEDNARDMDILRKSREAHAALRTLLKTPGFSVQGAEWDALEAAEKACADKAEHIEAVWN